MINNFTGGAKYLLQGFRLINQSGLRRFFVIPLLINIIVFTSLFYFASGYLEAFMRSLLPEGDQWWIGVVQVLAWLLFSATALIAVFFLFTIFANLIGAPFNGMLAQRVERYLTGQGGDGDAGLAQVLADAGASMLSELQKYMYFVPIAVLLVILTLIPLVNFAAPFAWAVFTAWMLVIEYLAYPMENHGYRFKQVRAALREKRMLGLGFGAATMVAMMIPLVNLLVMPAAVAGATVMWVEHWRQVGRQPA